MTTPPKTIKERFLHAFLFEAFAIGLSAPLAAWAMNAPLFEMGVLTVMIAVTALLWNMAYNAGFDRIENRFGWKRNVGVRLVHAIFFEIGLLGIVIPMTAWWLNIRLWEALLLDIALALFYLPYAFFYNLAYDTLRPKVIARLTRRKVAAGN